VRSAVSETPVLSGSLCASVSIRSDDDSDSSDSSGSSLDDFSSSDGEVSTPLTAVVNPVEASDSDDVDGADDEGEVVPKRSSKRLFSFRLSRSKEKESKSNEALKSSPMTSPRKGISSSSLDRIFASSSEKKKKDKEDSYRSPEEKTSSPGKQNSAGSLDTMFSSPSSKGKMKPPEEVPSRNSSRLHNVTKLLISPAIGASTSSVPSPADSSSPSASNSVSASPSGVDTPPSLIASGENGTPTESPGTTTKKSGRHNKSKHKHKRIRSNSVSLSSPEPAFAPDSATSGINTSVTDVTGCTASTLVCSCCRKRFFAVSSLKCAHGYFCQKCIAEHTENGVFSCPFCKEESQMPPPNTQEIDPVTLSLLMKRK